VRMQDPTPPRWQKILGIVLTVIPALMLTMSAAMKLTQNPEVVTGLAQAGFPAQVLVPLGVVELLGVILYVVPPTAVLGAVVLTGYLGGAVATHVRINDAFMTPVIIGVIVWAGLWLRDPRVRALLPLR
jgi:hypothetical protein